MRTRLLLSAAGLIVAFLLCETVLRISTGNLFKFHFYPDLYLRPKEGGEASRAAYHPTLGWIPNTGFQNLDGTESTILSYPGSIRSNGSGDLDRFTVEPDILTVGDSFTFGDTVGDSETWPAQLAAKTKLRILNGGVFGYGFDQIYLRTEELLKFYSPDRLIVQLIPDDLYRCLQVVRLWPKPYFSLDQNQQLVLQNTPVPLPIEGEGTERLNLLQSVFGYSFTANRLFSVLAPEQWFRYPIVLKKTSANQVNSADQVAIGCAIMHRLKLTAERNSIDLLILVQYLSTDLSNRNTQSAIQKVLDCAKLDQLEVLDLKDTLLQLKSRDEKKFLTLFRGHMTAAGNEFVADLINERLRLKPN